MPEEPFKLDPVFTDLYKHHQEAIRYNGQLPATLNEIGPIRHHDYVRNEGEGMVGAIRVFVDVPLSSDGRDRILEMQFHPLEGRLRIDTHLLHPISKESVALGGAVIPLTELLWPSNASTSMAVLRVAELLANDVNGTGSYASRDILQMFRIPQGTGYRRLTLTAGKALMEQRRVSLASDVRLEPAVGRWYACSKEPIRTEAPEELEVYVGCLSDSPHKYFCEDGHLYLRIADRGQSEAAIEWSCRDTSIDKPHQNNIPRDQRSEYVRAGNESIFEIPEKLALELQRFATPEFERRSHDIALSLLGSPQ